MRTSLRDVLIDGSISKAKKRPGDKDFLVFELKMNKCYITKMASKAQQADDTKERNMNYVS